MGSHVQTAAPQTVDGLTCQDVFCSGIAKIDKLPGGCLRFVIYVDQTTENGTSEHLVVCKMVWPIANIPVALRQVAMALTEGQAVYVENGKATLLM